MGWGCEISGKLCGVLVDYFQLPIKFTLQRIAITRLNPKGIVQKLGSRGFEVMFFKPKSENL